MEGSCSGVVPAQQQILCEKEMSSCYMKPLRRGVTCYRSRDYLILSNTLPHNVIAQSPLCLLDMEPLLLA